MPPFLRTTLYDMTGEATNHRAYEDPPLVPPYVTLHPTPDAGTYQEVPARASLIVWGNTSVRMCIAEGEAVNFAE